MLLNRTKKQKMHQCPKPISAIFALILLCFCVQYRLLPHAGSVHRYRIMANQHLLSVELAQTHVERRKGLMGRKNLGADQGMLFVFQQPQKQRFWMKNMLMSLDIIWLSAEGKIIDITEGVPPCQGVCKIYSHSGLAQFVLELNAGSAKRLGLARGMKITQIS